MERFGGRTGRSYPAKGSRETSEPKKSETPGKDAAITVLILLTFFLAVSVLTLAMHETPISTMLDDATEVSLKALREGGEWRSTFTADGVTVTVEIISEKEPK